MTEWTLGIKRPPVPFAASHSSSEGSKGELDDPLLTIFGESRQEEKKNETETELDQPWNWKFMRGGPQYESNL